jgi:hypothetical protein
MSRQSLCRPKFRFPEGAMASAHSQTTSASRRRSRPDLFVFDFDTALADVDLQAIWLFVILIGNIGKGSHGHDKRADDKKKNIPTHVGTSDCDAPVSPFHDTCALILNAIVVN